MSKPFVLWFTGLSGSGKTTLAKKMHTFLVSHGYQAVVIDGDEVRATISKDLGFTPEDIVENHRRILELCKTYLARDINVLVATISPHERVRKEARKQLPNFIEVFCDAPLAVCAARDVKGHYANVKSGNLKQFIGIDTTYEVPKNPDLVLKTNEEASGQSLQKIVVALAHRGIIISSFVAKNN